MRYRIDLGYDGALFHGWAKQPAHVSIQELIETKLAILLKHPVCITGAGRTDQGVHARGQVAHFDTENILILNKLAYSLNQMLPKEIQIYSIKAVPEMFHARFSAKKKLYVYQLTTRSTPFNWKYTYQIPQTFNTNLVQEGCQYFLGTHDFTSFTNKGCGSKEKIKTLYQLNLIKNKENINIMVQGNGFLYKMVRNIVGLLIEIGRGKRLPSEISNILNEKNRQAGYMTAPPHPLFLEQVDYD